MLDDNPAPTADEQPDASETQPELSDVESDAINSMTNVKGELTTNADPLTIEEPEVEEPTDEPEDKPVDKPISEPSEPGGEEDEEKEAPETPTTDEPAPEIAIEKDEAGVYQEPTVIDPGDFKPADYSFEVRTTDGKTHKIMSPEDADNFANLLDTDPELISASQFSIFNRKAAVMEQGIAADKRGYDTDKQQFEEEQQLKQTRDNTVQQWSKEIDYLASKGDLPEISSENNTADWTNSEVSKDPAVKARLDVLSWMSQENEKRMAAGLDPMHSIIDAHNAMQLESMKRGEQEQTKTQTRERQKRGSMVGKKTSYSPENQPTGSIVGLGGSLNDLVHEYMNS